jgi:hypothetical protein
MKYLNYYLIFAAMFCLLIQAASAEIPQAINYQGYLTDDLGDPVDDGDYSIVFKIYDSAEDGTLLWASVRTNVWVENGLFSCKLGPFQDNLFASDTSRWLAIRIGADPDDISPRSQLIAVSYAYHALRADSAEAGGGWVEDGSAVRLQEESDLVGIGTSSPTHRLHIIGSESNPLLNVEKMGPGRGVRVYTSSACALWVENSGNHGLRVTNANGDGIHVTQAGGYAGYFNGTGYFRDNVGIGVSAPGEKLEVDGTIKTTGFNMLTGASDGYVLTSDAQGVGSWQTASAGDITSVTASGGLSGGGMSGDVILAIASDGVTEDKVADNAITSLNILDGEIVNADISSSALISPSKISGTAATLENTQTFTDQNTFDDYVYFSDSTMRLNSTGISIGSISSPLEGRMIDISRNYNTSSYRYGLYCWPKNAGTGKLYGVYSRVDHTTAGSAGDAYGVFGYTKSDGTHRYGVYGHGFTQSSYNHIGFSYGVYGYGVDGEIAYGVYGKASAALTNYAGYFEGNVEITGGLSKGYGSFKIDHPLDPENKYLYHSFIESPDMMNVYNGNATLDADGEVVIELPEYFEALNKDFRYQITCIGGFAPVYVADEISNNQFKIAGGNPGLKVSWQVTGIRKDPLAEANRIKVEVEKTDKEKGLYIQPAVYGLSEDKFIHYNPATDQENVTITTESE